MHGWAQASLTRAAPHPPSPGCQEPGEGPAERTSLEAREAPGGIYSGPGPAAWCCLPTEPRLPRPLDPAIQRRGAGGVASCPLPNRTLCPQLPSAPLQLPRELGEESPRGSRVQRPALEEEEKVTKSWRYQGHVQPSPAAMYPPTDLRCALARLLVPQVLGTSRIHPLTAATCRPAPPGTAVTSSPSAAGPA